MPGDITKKEASWAVTRWLRITGVLLLVATAAGVWFYFSRPKQVPIVRVQRGTVVRAFYATGVVRPDFEYILKSKAQGSLLALEKREGARVSKGERLARIDDRQLKNELEKCTAELAEARKQATDDAPQRKELLARLNEAHLQAQMAKENVERTQMSYEQKAATLTDVDSARRSDVQWANTVAAMESQINSWKISSQRGVDVAEANLRKAQANLADTEVIAPIDGIILERYVENQEVVGINQKLLLVAASDDLLMRAAVDEEDITRTHEGQNVKMQLYAFQNRGNGTQPTIFEGKVTEILPSANSTNKTYEVKIAFIDRPRALKVGMTGELNFIEQESAKDGALIVPSAAVLDGKVYRSTGNSAIPHYEPVPVKIGMRNLDEVEITEGVSEGEAIVADAKQVAPVKLPARKLPVVPTRTGDNIAEQDQANP